MLNYVAYARLDWDYDVAMDMLRTLNFDLVSGWKKITIKKCLNLIRYFEIL